MADTIIPIDFFVETPPQDVPATDQKLLNLIANSLGTNFASYSGQYIIGQLGGNLPSSDVGPWANGAEWWYWNNNLGSYQRVSDGVPIGAIMIWGGQGVPTNWLLCDGTALSATDYNLLYQVIGTDWGGDGNVFNLPPPAKIYFSDSGFTPNSQVPLDLGSPASGWGTRGGSQLAPKFVHAQIPGLKVRLPYDPVLKLTIDPTMGGFQYGALQAPVGTVLHAEELRDANDENIFLEATTTQIPLMPPFAASNFIIKYQ